MSYRPDFRDDAPIYAADQADNREQLRADSIARIGAADAREPATFLPTAAGAVCDADWRRWLAAPFEAWLGQAFVEVYGAATRMRSERIAAIDHEIGERLDAATCARSRLAAAPWLEGRTAVQRQPQWVKYLMAQAAGEVPGHVTTIFALQAALFHLPLLPALTAYVIFEGMNGHAAVMGNFKRDTDVFAARHPEGIEAARRVFRAAAGSDAGGAGLASV